MQNKRRIIKFVSKDEEKNNIECKKEKINGKEFLLALKDAGKRNIEGKIVFQQNLKREDEIKAIDNYIGFDRNKDFGQQEMVARMAAMQEIKPVKGEAFKRCSVSNTIKGYIQGSNNPILKKKSHIEACINICLEKQAILLKEIQDKNLSDEDKAFKEALLKVEEERVENLKKQFKDI